MTPPTDPGEARRDLLWQLNRFGAAFADWAVHEDVAAIENGPYYREMSRQRDALLAALAHREPRGERDVDVEYDAWCSAKGCGMEPPSRYAAFCAGFRAALDSTEESDG